MLLTWPMQCYTASLATSFPANLILESSNAEIHMLETDTVGEFRTLNGPFAVTTRGSAANDQISKREQILIAAGRGPIEGCFHECYSFWRMATS